VLKLIVVGAAVVVAVVVVPGLCGLPVPVCFPEVPELAGPCDPAPLFVFGPAFAGPFG